MNNENKPKLNYKRKFPGGFLFILLIIMMVFLTFQNIASERNGAKVSFSHEIEHLVNLDLLNKDDSKKLALNDNLVTFSGKFKDKQSPESQARFRFLELLNEQHELQSAKERLAKSLDLLEVNVKNSADLFLLLSGLPLPKGGYKVVDSLYDMPERQNGIIIKSLTPREIVSLSALKKELNSLTPHSSAEASNFETDLKTLIEGFRSPSLGIGNEALKNELKSLQDKLTATSSLTIPEKLGLYRQTLDELEGIVSQLNQEQDHMRLLQLRSVRNYKAELEQYGYISGELEKNTAQLDKARENVVNVIWFFNNQELSTRALEKQDPEAFNLWFQEAKQEWENFSFNKGLAFRVPDQSRTTALDKTFKSEELSPNYLSYFFTFLPVLLVLLLIYFVFARQMKGVGAGAMSFGKSPAKLFNKGMHKITFKDVAGIDEAKEELQEIVDFLKDPGRFTALGAQIPKGVLCIGPPGTGKTLIARAVAGEADRPFFLISGSDFVEMFVGVGASRIRSLFEEAKKNAPCIIFIDEIDAVGRHRGAGFGGGHDEREQTLNQLLVEMDGFDPNEGVILIAATNRPDVLDKALLRPGRFDRRIVIDLPDLKGRFEILKVHARKIKLDPYVDLMLIARNTPGASGADLRNILNESALLAARKGRAAVTLEDAFEACDKVRYGKERRSLEVDLDEKRTTAFHESGHAIVGLVVKHADPVDKITVIPRGMSLGATHFLPKKNRLNYWKREALDQLAVLMGGRAAEEVFVGDISSGAAMDIAQATKLVRSMVCEWGMTELGLVAFDDRTESNPYLGLSDSKKTYSENTAKAIDEQVHLIVNEAHDRALAIIQENRDKVLLMTDMLMEFETLDRDDVKLIMEGQWSVDEKKERLKRQVEAHRSPSQKPAEPLMTPPPMPQESN